ncbi:MULTISPECIES: SUKH-4 family immunity protein [unclassified Streptomyces]|uniref:SUKH-4 family immunity protein n=1 Tax=unclassified Streptomyces TaxID=2593676 RepID=UPI0033EBCF85
MIFDLSHGDLVQTFGAEHVHQVPEAAAQAAGFSGETLAFLTTVGLPENEFVSFPKFTDAAARFRPVVSDETETQWDLPPAASQWITLGNFEISAIVMAPQYGEVYELAEGIMRPVLLHKDLSSLVHTITELTKIVQGLPEDYDDDDEYMEQLEETLDSLKDEVGSQDPNPFSGEHSEWVEIITNIGAGMWG